MKSLIALIIALTTFQLSAQNLTQTIRGTIIDQDSQVPLPGATVIIAGSSPILGAVTDADGNFRINGVPVGRVSLRVSYMGYEEKTIPNLLLGAAKEELLNITLVESVNTLDEVVIKGDAPKGEVLNEMALISAHTFSVEETQRYAGSFDDPARMVVAFAGVNGDAEGNNDIIVRGNSPKGILWRLEGIAIPNPNHFAGEGSTGGPINALSSKMLSNSDFFTGAFSPEYGDATSGVFDMKLKKGNNEQREYTAAISTLGIDVTAEGPFSTNSKASYIANYRYSALDLLDRAGVVDFGGVPRYQDMSFKISLPLNSKHYFSLFGLGGMSGIDTEEKDEHDEQLITGKFNGDNKLGVLGLTHTWQINDDMFLRLSVAETGTESQFRFAIPDASDHFYVIENGTIGKLSSIGTTTFNYKINSRHKIETGVIFTRLRFNMSVDEWNFDNEVLENQLSDEGGSSTFQGFASWKFRVNDDLTLISGLHYIRLSLNSNHAVEPRMALKWQTNDRAAFNLGAGLHSKVEGISTYLAKRTDSDGSLSQPNKDLGLTRAAHFVVGYDNQLAANTHLKVETYYQSLFSVPVENDALSAFSLLNVSEGYTTRDLRNSGSGKNYGVEFTIERYLNRGLYYMGTLSLFRSLYTAADGIERKSAFDNNYVANFIGGKEFNVGAASKNKVFFVNTKVAIIGGKRYSPVLLEESIAAGHEVIDETNPFSKKSGDIFRTDFSLGLRRNRKRTTTEFKIDVQNIFNNQTVVSEDYINASQSIYRNKQLGMLPTISYKISF